MLPQAPPRRPARTKWIVIAVIVIVVGAFAALYALLPAFTGPSIVTYATTSELTTLDPSTEFSNSILVLPNMYETLTYYNTATQTVEPLLATNWTSEGGGTVWTFTLRPGVRFHDGTTLDAQAVKFSVERTMRMYNETGQGAGFIWTFPLDGIEVVDNLTVRFTTLYATPVDVIASAGYGAYIISPRIAELGNDTAQAAWFNEGHSAGTGPYLIASPSDWDASGKARIVLTRFDDYWRGWSPGKFDRAIIRTIPDAGQRQLAVTDGDVDITVDIPVQNVPALRDNPRVKFVNGPGYRSLYALFNNEAGPLRDANARKAVAHAIPYQDIINTALGGFGNISHGVIPAGMWGHDSALTSFDSDLVRARQFRENSTTCATGCTLKLTHVAGDKFEIDTAALMKDSLAQININLVVEAMPWEDQWALAQSGPNVTGDPNQAVQDIFVMYWWPTYITPYDFLFNMWHTSSYAFFNLGYYQNSTFDALIDGASGLEALDRDQAFTYYSAAQQMLIDDTVGLAIFDLQNIHLHKETLRGFRDNPAYPLVVYFYELTRA